MRPTRPPLELILWLIGDPQHNFSAGVMRLGLLFGRDRFVQWPNLRDDGFNFSCIDQLCDLRKIFGIWFDRDPDRANLVLLEFFRIWPTYQFQNDTALVHYSVRSGKCVFPHRIQHAIDVFRDFFEFLFGIIDRDISAQLLEQILVRGGRSCDDVSATRFGCAVAGISVTRPGTANSMPTRSEVEDVISRTRKQSA